MRFSGGPWNCYQCETPLLFGEGIQLGMALFCRNCIELFQDTAALQRQLHQPVSPYMELSRDWPTVKFLGWLKAQGIPLNPIEEIYLRARLAIIKEGLPR